MMNVSTTLQLAASRIQRQYGNASSALAKSMERLSTGKQINRASDDPAGVVAIDPMKGRLQEISGSLKRLDQNDAYLGAREGGLSVLSDSLVELKQLVVTAGNRDGLSKDERDALQTQAAGIIDGIDFLANTSNFNGQQIMQGYSSGSLGLGGLLGSFNLADGDVESADKAIQAAIDNVATSRGSIGNAAKNNDSERRTLMSEQENLTGVVSSIEDTDFAKETAALVRAQLMQDVAAFLQKNTLTSASDTVLALIKGVAQQK